MTNLEAFTSFNEIEDRELQAYNRAKFLYNLFETATEDETEKYYQDFPKEEQVAIFAVLAKVRQSNWDEVGKDIAKLVAV